MRLADVLPDAPTTTEAALVLFDAAPAVEADAMVGTWRGAELPTEHPIDGMLEASGWWGKQFLDAETVHPLLFPTADGSALWALNPVLAFGGLGLARRVPALAGRDLRKVISTLRPLTSTTSPKARLRTTRYRGVDTATMVYDQLPINDVFRRIDEHTVVGAMDLASTSSLADARSGSTRRRTVRAPYFFVLRRDDSLALR